MSQAIAERYAGLQEPGDTVCYCFNVGVNTIKKAIFTGRLTEVAEVTAATGACGGCQSCRMLIEDLIAEVWADIDAAAKEEK